MEQAVSLMGELIEYDANDMISGDICMQPPLDTNDSAEDSDDEDQPTSLSHLARNQLTAKATLSIETRSNSVNLVEEDSEDEIEDMIREPLAKRGRTSKSSPPERQWETKDFIPNIDNSNPITRDPKQYTAITCAPTDFFELFFDHELLSHICECSEKYAKNKGNFTFQLDVSTLKGFLLAILMLSGYNDLPRRNMHWERAPTC